MNETVDPEFSQPNPEDCSCVQLEILLEETWIDRFITEHKTEVPINEQYTITNLKINIGAGTLNFKADLKEKEGTSIDLTSTPVWEVENQRILIENLDLETSSKNILLKTAGWFAQNFLNNTIDKKIEEQVNRMYQKQLAKLKSQPLDVPIPKGGNAKITIANITINELTFIEHAIHIKAMIEGIGKIQLS